MLDQSEEDAVVNGVTRKTLQKIWTAVALSTFVFCYLAMTAVQGDLIKVSASVPVKLEFSSGRPDAVIAMAAIPIIALLLWLGGDVLREHATRGGQTWFERYPFRLYDASPQVGVGRLAQWFAFIFFTLAPLLVLMHMWRVFAHEGALCRQPESSGGWTALPAPASSAEKWTRWFALPDDASFAKIVFDGYRLAGESALADNCAGAVTFFPVAQPLLMATLTAIAVFSALRGVRQVFTRPIERVDRQNRVE